jgi:ABC-type sulfate transport system permease component
LEDGAQRPAHSSGLQNTLIVAVSAALFGVLFFSLVGYVLVRTKLPGRGILDSICWLPSAIPGVLAGLGLLGCFWERRCSGHSMAPLSYW